MLVQELIELLKEESPYKAVWIDLGDDAVGIAGIKDFGEFILIVPDNEIED